METPFIYGQIAMAENYIPREKELQWIISNFQNQKNTIIIAPRRWGKSSLANKACERLLQDKANPIIVCQLDIFNCRTTEQFFTAYSHAIIQAARPVWDKINLKKTNLSMAEILDLPQRIALETGKRVAICIDEFQTINKYPDSLNFQRILATHWKSQNQVWYCLCGNKRDWLLHHFHSYSVPFYKFGEMLVLPTIERNQWVQFISERFQATGKHISKELCVKIADTMQNHPHYTQQYSQQVWFRTEKECSESILQAALAGMMNQLNLPFVNIIDSLTTRQVAFVTAIASGDTNFSSKAILQKYSLGTYVNIQALQNALLERDMIDIIPGKRTKLQDPAFEYWVKTNYM